MFTGSVSFKLVLLVYLSYILRTTCCFYSLVLQSTFREILINIMAAAGWGRTIGGGSAADTLQQAMLPVAAHSACSRVNGRLLPVDERSMVCAGGQGKGGCQVDKPKMGPCRENCREYFFFALVDK